MLIEMRNNRTEEPELQVSRERHNMGTAEIVACLPLLPVLDHHQVVGVFIELRKQKPETGIASSGQNFSISQTLLFRAVATMAR